MTAEGNYITWVDKEPTPDSEEALQLKWDLIMKELGEVNHAFNLCLSSICSEGMQGVALLCGRRLAQRSSMHFMPSPHLKSFV